MKTNLRKCPHCGSDEGYYEKQYVSGDTIFRYNYDGSEAENSDIHEPLTYRRKSKFAYCLECHKRLFVLEDT